MNRLVVMTVSQQCVKSDAGRVRYFDHPHHENRGTSASRNLVQTLQFIYDVCAAVKFLARILKPGGVLLATVPGVSQLGRDEWRDDRCWSFTTQSALRLFNEGFAPDRIEVAAHGNVLAATAFLQGIAAGELHRGELDHHDPGYEMLITVRAVKSARAS